MSSGTARGKSIMANALRLAANIIAERRSGVLKKIFVRIALKKGRAAAITALARRLAEIFWIMTAKKVPYKCMNEQEYSQKIKMTVIKNIRTKMKKLNINTNELIFEGSVTSSFS